VTSSVQEPPSVQSGRRGLILDGLLAAAVLLTGLVLYQPGVFTVDESHYLLAAQAMADRGSFRIENGYEQTGEESLLFFYTVVPDRVDQLGTVSTVPPYHAILAAPFLAIGGLTGLLWVNLLAFAAAAIAVRRLASRIRPEGWFPWGTAALFVAGSCGMEYALGVWPHSLSQSLIAWSLLLLVSTPDGKRGWVFALLAGLLGGLATGVRLQNILLLPVLLVSARWFLHLGWSRLAIHIAGWMVPLIGMSLINLHRLQTLNPFTYGWSKVWEKTIYGKTLAFVGSQPWIVAAVVLAVAGICWLWRRKQFSLLVSGFALAIVASVAFVPGIRSSLAHWISMAGYHLLDSTFLPSGTLSAGSATNRLGQNLYGGVLKKGLLEVLPFLVLSLYGLAAFWRRKEGPSVAGFLACFGWCGAAFLPVVLSAGGLCYNPRYMLELLPALVTVSLYLGLRLSFSRTLMLGGALAGILFSLPVLANPGSVAQPDGGWYPLLVPLVGALALLVVSGFGLFGVERWQRLGRAGGTFLFAATLAYGCLVQLGVDLKTSLTVRHYSSRILEEGRRVIPDDSVLLTWKSHKDVFSPLKLDRDTWIGGLGEFDQTPDLSRLNTGARRIFVLRNGIPDAVWNELTGSFRTRATETRGLVFVELIRRETR
jgi:hypothetical protein